ncbi:hypothetical protein ACFFF3_19130, partial [Mongoliitalea lutea]|uniref:hypothetical protein n=1 Tax=Mongoliitalea lutea TaxID=849756 RepID=UPI0035EB27A4
NLDAGVYTYYLELSGPQFCTIVEPGTVTVNPPIGAVLDVVDILCFGEQTGRIVVASNPNATYRYRVDGSTPMLQSELEAMTFVAGTYVVAIFDDNTGCTTSQTVVISEPPLLVFQNLGFEHPTCGAFNGELEFSVAGGIGPYEVLINGASLATFDFTEDQGLYVVSNLSPGFYSIEIVDANNCTIVRQNEYELVNDDLEPITVDPLEDTICQGVTATLLPSITTAVPPIKRWYLNA